MITKHSCRKCTACSLHCVRSHARSAASLARRCGHTGLGPRARTACAYAVQSSPSVRPSEVRRATPCRALCRGRGAGACGREKSEPSIQHHHPHCCCCSLANTATAVARNRDGSSASRSSSRKQCHKMQCNAIRQSPHMVPPPTKVAERRAGGRAAVRRWARLRRAAAIRGTAPRAIRGAEFALANAHCRCHGRNGG